MDFIDSAQRNRKYPGNTASARRSAVRLFEQELNDQEKESFDTLKKNFEQVYLSVFNKNKSMTAESLQTYKNRFLSLIKDYEKYGLDPTKMANWNRRVRRISITGKAGIKEKEGQPIQETERYKEIDMSRFELPLRVGVKAIILVPSDITKEEVDKIRKYIDFLDSISNTSPNNEKE